MTIAEVQALSGYELNRLIHALEGHPLTETKYRFTYSSIGGIGKHICSSFDRRESAEFEREQIMRSGYACTDIEPYEVDIKVPNYCQREDLIMTLVRALPNEVHAMYYETMVSLLPPRSSWFELLNAKAQTRAQAYLFTHENSENGLAQHPHEQAHVWAGSAGR